jgi:hypothetical protein
MLMQKDIDVICSRLKEMVSEILAERSRVAGTARVNYRREPTPASGKPYRSDPAVLARIERYGQDHGLSSEGAFRAFLAGKV